MKLTPELTLEYQSLYDSMTIHPEHQREITDTAKRIKSLYGDYTDICVATGVPASVVGMIHLEECNLSFAKHLHNGDSLKQRTVHVPMGRPQDPPANGNVYTFTESAIDALKYEAKEMGITINGLKWEFPTILWFLETYNGWGYRNKGINTPYLWSYTNHYTSGKYTSDGHYNAETVSDQCGLAGILRELSGESPPVLNKKPVKTFSICAWLGGIR